MATLRDLGLEPRMTGAAPTLRDMGVMPRQAIDVMPLEDQANANSMGQLRRGFTSGQLGAEANAMAADESSLRAQGRAAEADALRSRIGAVQQRAATFAPKEQDVTQLNWGPGRILDYGLGAVGQGTASMLEPAGAAAGLGAASQVLGAIPTAPTRLLGGALRLAAPAAAGYLNFRQAKGEFYNDAVEDPAAMAGKTPEEINTAANKSGVLAGAFDTILPGLAAERMVGRQGLKALAKMPGAAKVGLDLAGEGATEVAQGEVKRHFLSDLNPLRDTSKDSTERWNDLAGGILGAGPISTASHIMANGHKRLGVEDDPNNDVSGKDKPNVEPKTGGSFTDVLKRGTEERKANPKNVEAWRNELSGIGDDDIVAASQTQHAALVKELGARVAKGEPGAQEHLDALQAQDPNDPLFPMNDEPRMAARDFLIGDGSDEASVKKLYKAYEGRKLNTQIGYNDIGRKVAAEELGGKVGAGEAIKPNDPARADAITKYREMGQRARLTADVMAKALPKTMRKYGKVAAALGQEIAHFAGNGYENPTAGDTARVLRMGASMVALYGGEKAHDMVVQAGRAAGIEGTKLFKTLNASVSVARESPAAYQKAQTVSREAAAEQLTKVIPPAVELKLRKDGVDLTDPNTREHLLSMVEDSFDGTGMSEEAMTKTLGKETVDALREVIGQPIAPRKKVAPTEEQSNAKDAPETKTPTESDESTGDGGFDNESDAWAVEGAKKNVEAAPGSKIYFSRGVERGVSVDSESNPFMPDKKTGKLPWLSRKGDRLMMKGDEPGKRTGPNTLEDMHAKAFVALGGIAKRITSKTKRPAKERDQYGMLRNRTVTEDLGINEIAPDGKSEAAFGIGSHRIRTISAKEAMDTHGVSASRRVDLMRDYAGRMADGKVTLSKDDPTIQQLRTLEKRISKLEESTPKELVKGIGPKGAVTAENPKRAEIDSLKGQYTEAITKLAEKLGVEPKEGMTTASLADAYFSDRFMVVAEQTAEKDQLRLDPAEVTKMIRRGNDDLDYAMQFRAAGTQAKVEADMNLIRFKSDQAVTGDGIAVVRASALVKWVRDNRNEFTKRETNTATSTAIDFRNDLMEGIGALAAGEYMDGLPYMINAKGEVESFAKGFPPSLKLDTTTQKKLDNKRTKIRDEVKARLAAGLPGSPESDTVVDQDAVAREQAMEPKADRNTDADELIDEGQERKRAKTEVNKDRGAGPVHPDDALTITDSARYWDAPRVETADELRRRSLGARDKEGKPVRVAKYPIAPETVDNHDGQSSQVPSEFEPRKQRSGVPTDRTDLMMRNEVRNAALDKVDTLTPTNAVHKGARLAESIWGGFRDDPRGSFLRLQRLVNALAADPYPEDGKPAGGKHYAAALAPLLTPNNIEKLVATAKDPSKAKTMLEGMRDKTAAAIASAEFEISSGDKLKLAKLLMGQPNASIAKAREFLGEAKPIVSKVEPAAKKPGAVTLTGKSQYLAKDQAKANTATKFIGRGSEASSTAQYAKDFGDKANSGSYTAADRVFVSAEGNREGRVNPDRAELDKAVAAGATFITDDEANRTRPYNIGERQIAKYLTEKGYTETKPGEWTKPSTAVRKLNTQTKPMQQLSAATIQTVAQTRFLMRLLGFKAAPAQFADVAEKLLIDPSQDPAAFIKQSAQALSHILIRRDNVKQAMKGVAWAQERTRLIAKLTGEGMGRIAAQEQAFQTLVGEVLAEQLKARTTAEHMSSSTIFSAAKGFVSAFKKMTATNEFTEVVRNELNKLIEQANNPERLKEGFTKVTFQEAVDGDPQAAAVLAHMAANPKAVLTGSIVLSASGSVYRNAKNMLHDLDFVFNGTHAEAAAYLEKAFPGSAVVNGFQSASYKVDTHIVPPPGTKLTGVSYKAGKASYTVERDGQIVGRQWHDAAGNEHKEGVGATIVDFFTGEERPAAQTIPFTAGGKQHNVRAVSAGNIFEKKLEMGRAKDMLDFQRYVPEAGRKLNTQTKPAGVQAAESTPDQTAIDEARDYVKKVLGPKVKVEFLKAFDAAGEWIDAENLMKLSLASGPGLLTTAHHESMHALWGQLIKNHPDAAGKLAHVMSSPEIRERLEAMLHDEPAALAALSDPEERVAYAYQFWAAGMLDVDKPATTMFAKLRKLLRKVFGMVRDSETALDIMTAFHEGKLAEPSAAGRVIEGIMARETWNDDVKRKFDSIIQHLHASTMVSNEVLRGSESATARRLASMMFSNPGRAADSEDPEGYLNARTRVVRQYTNFLYKAVKNLSPRDMEAATKFLQTKADLKDIHYAPVREAVKDVRALTKRYYGYATRDAGLNLEYLGDNHFPRVWDVARLVEKRDEFIAMVLQPKYAKTMEAALKIANSNPKLPTKSAEDIAALMHEEMVRKNGVDEKGIEAERDDNDVLSPFFASQKERSFKWLDDADVEPFLEKDLIGAMSRYLHQGIRAAEYARRFGNGGSKLRQMAAAPGEMFLKEDDEGRMVEDWSGGTIYHELVDAAKEQKLEGVEAEKWVARRMEDIKNSIAAHEGSLGSASITPLTRKFSSAAMAYQNLRLLPFSLFAAFADPLSLAARGPGVKAAFDAFTQGLKDVWARWKDAASDTPTARQRTVWDEMAETAGVVDSHMFLEQIGKAHTSEFMTDFARKSNRALFMANGLTAWDRSMRVTATKYAALFLQDHKNLPDKDSARWLKELGLEPKDIPLDGDGKLIFDRNILAASRLTPDMTDDEKAAVREKATQEIEKIHYAITRWVEGAVLTPNAAQRPTWGSDPRWAVLFHLKQFTYSFQDTVLRRAFAEASQGNMNPIGALAASVPTMMVSDILKGFVMGGGSLPPYMKTWGLGDHLMHGVSRAGLAGTSQFGIDALRDPASLAGPTVEQIVKTVFNPGDLGKNVVDAIPGARFLGPVKDLGRAID